METNKVTDATKDVVITAKDVKKDYGIKVKSKEVWIRHKPITGSLPFQSKDAITLNKIGSSFASGGSDVLRGLSNEEEMKYLPDVIGGNPKNEGWEKATKDYWINITKTIPPPDKDGTGGLKLEVGRTYFSQEDEDFDMYCTDESLKRGKPISMSDFILWRYCLKYNRVANSIDDIYKSPKIDFYLYSKEEEIKAKKSNFKIIKDANQLFYSKMADRSWVDWVLRVFVSGDKEATIFIKDLDSTEEDEKDIELEKYVKKSPERFLTIGTDANLELRSFIELCVATNKLTRLANTDTLLMGDVTLGNSTNEAIAFLKNPKNSKVYDTLKAQVKLVP
jgi:hypothetical protein